MTTGSNPLLLPALRATMGDWVYYVSAMTMQDIAFRVSVVDDIHSSRSLKECFTERPYEQLCENRRIPAQSGAAAIQRDRRWHLWRQPRMARTCP